MRSYRPTAGADAHASYRRLTTRVIRELNFVMARLRLFAAVVDGAYSLRDFLTLAAEKGGVSQPVIINKSLLYAVNGDMRGLDFPVSPSGEVAILPCLIERSISV